MTAQDEADRDRYYMRIALREAARGRGSTRPNPMVGCVIVRDGEVVGSGFHARVGEDHAEVVALRAAGPLARGAEVFVNLEPCSHFGRTPPCSQALIDAGVRRVVAGMIDPNPRVSGRGLAQLNASGIATTVGVLEEEARRLNEGFVRHVSDGRPFVTLKLAVSLDGRIATRTGDSRWITGETARRDVHRLRAQSDVVLVGTGTLRADNPRLTARDGEALLPHQPVRAAIDARLGLPDDSSLLDTDPSPVLLFCGPEASPERIHLLRQRGVDVVVIPADEQGLLVLTDLIAELARRDLQTLLVEGGGGLGGGLLDLDLVDRVLLYQAPLLIGGAEAIPAIGGVGAATVAGARRARTVRREILGEDVRIEVDLH